MALSTRADAVRNRTTVLDATAALFREASPGEVVSIEAIAERAGLGKATVLRAYGDRAALLSAVVQRESATVVAQIEQGPAPLGPDTAPAERLVAVLGTLVRLKLSTRSLSLALEEVGRGSPYRAPAYDWWHDLLSATLLGLPQTAADAGHAAYLAHTLLAAVRSDLVEHLLTVEGLTPDDVVRRTCEQARRVVTSS